MGEAFRYTVPTIPGQPGRIDHDIKWAPTKMINWNSSPGTDVVIITTTQDIAAFRDDPLVTVETIEIED